MDTSFSCGCPRKNNPFDVFLEDSLVESLNNDFPFIPDWGFEDKAKQMKYLVRLMHKQLRFIVIHYSRFKRPLTWFYKWIWCKVKELIIFEEEDCS